MDGFLFMASLVFSLAGLIFFYLLTRHRERTQMIERGADASLFQAEPRKKSYFLVMLLGILFICIALGIGVGFLVEDAMMDSGMIRKNNSNPGPYFFGIFLMLGVGFVTAFLLNKKLNLKE